MDEKTKWKWAIKTIIKFRKTFLKIDKKERTPDRLCGLLGEYYVLRKLSKLGLKPKHKGGQGGYDISLNGDKVKIEVRTSLLKNEGIYPKGINFWGWAVKRKSQKEIKFDFLIAVALDKNWKAKFYIFNRKEAVKSNIKIPRYEKTIEKAVQLFENKTSYMGALKKMPSIRKNRCIVNINSNPRKFLDRWDKICG